MKTAAAYRHWLKMIAISSANSFKFGLVYAILGMLAIYLFHPTAKADESVTFLLVPMVTLYFLMQVGGAWVTRIKVPDQARIVPDLRTRFIIWALFFALLAVFIGVPSLFVYGRLGISWAVDFTWRALVLFVTAALVASAMARTNALCVFEYAARFLTVVAHHGKHAHNH